MLIRFTGILLFLFTFGCGIYTTTGSLNPPFNQTKNSTTLTFSGNNTESYFSGYVMWYKENQEGSYTVCGYKNQIDVFPTIPREASQDWVSFTDLTNDVDNPRIVYMVEVADLYPQENLSTSFYELNQDEGKQYFFAVSASGVNDEESEKIEFGRWP